MIKPTILEIQQAVVRRFQMKSVDELIGLRQNQQLCWPRHVAIYLCQKLTFEPLTEIGRAFHRKHNTAFHSVKVVEDRISIYPEEKKLIEQLEAQLTQASRNERN